VLCAVAIAFVAHRAFPPWRTSRCFSGSCVAPFDSQRLQRDVRVSCKDKRESFDGSWTLPEGSLSKELRLVGAMQDRDILKLGKAMLRQKAVPVKAKNVTNLRSQDVAAEMIRVMRVQGLGFSRGGCLAAPQLGIPSRLIVLEDPQGAIDDLVPEERKAMGREKAFGPKAIFNPVYKPVGERKTVLWERSKSIPGYRALVERPWSVEVTGVDAEGHKVEYIAEGWEAREVQRATDALDGLYFTDRCIMRSLRKLDAPDDPLPPDVPAEGEVGMTSRPPLTDEQIAKAANDAGVLGTSVAGFFSAVGLQGPPTMFVGSLILRMKARAVEAAELSSASVKSVVELLRKAWEFEEHPLGIAAPQLGSSVRAVLVGEREDTIEELKLSKGERFKQGRTAYGPKLLFNPVVTPASDKMAYFYETSASVPGYRAIVGRAVDVNVEGIDEHGRLVRIKVSGWPARMWQHATDVLDGVLYVDRMERKSFGLAKIADPPPNDCPFGLMNRPAVGRTRSSASRGVKTQQRRNVRTKVRNKK